MPTIVVEAGTVSWELWGVRVIRQKLNQIWRNIVVFAPNCGHL